MATEAPTENYSAIRARENLADAMSAVSEAGKRILRELMRPGNVGKPVWALCEAAKVSEARYYQLMRDPDFLAAQRLAKIEALGDITPQIEAVKINALRPGKDGAADRRLLTEMADRLPRRQLDVNVSGSVEHRLNATPLSQILWVYKRLNVPPERWLPAIRDQYEAGVLHEEMPPLKLISRQVEPIDGEMVHEEIVQEDRPSQEPRDDTPPPD
ncbi:MAG: hypothetical protein ABSH22_05575 [Tepidisphaeraceae bacterium]|jgi:hypothetical protein